MNNLEYIESYFKNEVSQEEKVELEKRIQADPEFADDIVFYLSSRGMAGSEQQQKKDRFRQIYEQYKEEHGPVVHRTTLVRKLWPWAAAAAVLAGVIVTWNAWFRPVSSGRLAEKYIASQFQSLPVMMNDGQDSLQTGLRLYNEGKFEQSLALFETILLRDTNNDEAKKYAGIVSLWLEQYDKAISYFTQLSNNTRLYANPGKFYHALTLLKRNLPGDEEKAKQLLQQVVQEDLEGRQEAEKWLKEL